MRRTEKEQAGERKAPGEKEERTER